MLDDVPLILKLYTRIFLSQGVGLVGLLWCLGERQATLGVILATLLLADQIIFFRTRLPPDTLNVSHRRIIDGWCLAVGALDVLIVFAILYQAAGLHETNRGLAITDAQSALAYSIATIARLGLDLSPSTGGGRLLASVEALLGDAVLIAAVVAIIRTRRS